MTDVEHTDIHLSIASITSDIVIALINTANLQPDQVEVKFGSVYASIARAIRNQDRPKEGILG